MFGFFYLAFELYRERLNKVIKEMENERGEAGNPGMILFVKQTS